MASQRRWFKSCVLRLEDRDLETGAINSAQRLIRDWLPENLIIVVKELITGLDASNTNGRKERLRLVTYASDVHGHLALAASFPILMPVLEKMLGEFDSNVGKEIEALFGSLAHKAVTAGTTTKSYKLPPQWLSQLLCHPLLRAMRNDKMRAPLCCRCLYAVLLECNAHSVTCVYAATNCIRHLLRLFSRFHVVASNASSVSTIPADVFMPLVRSLELVSGCISTHHVMALVSFADVALGSKEWRVRQGGVSLLHALARTIGQAVPGSEVMISGGLDPDDLFDEAGAADHRRPPSQGAAGCAYDASIEEAKQVLSMLKSKLIDLLEKVRYDRVQHVRLEAAAANAEFRIIPNTSSVADMAIPKEKSYALRFEMEGLVGPDRSLSPRNVSRSSSPIAARRATGVKSPGGVRPGSRSPGRHPSPRMQGGVQGVPSSDTWGAGSAAPQSHWRPRTPPSRISHESYTAPTMETPAAYQAAPPDPPPAKWQPWRRADPSSPPMMEAAFDPPSSAFTDEPSQTALSDRRQDARSTSAKRERASRDYNLQGRRMAPGGLSSAAAGRTRGRELPSDSKERPQYNLDGRRVYRREPAEKVAGSGGMWLSHQQPSHGGAAGPSATRSKSATRRSVDSRRGSDTARAGQDQTVARGPQSSARPRSAVTHEGSTGERSPQRASERPPWGMPRLQRPRSSVKHEPTIEIYTKPGARRHTPEPVPEYARGMTDLNMEASPAEPSPSGSPTPPHIVTSAHAGPEAGPGSLPYRGDALDPGSVDISPFPAERSAPASSTARSPSFASPSPTADPHRVINIHIHSKPRSGSRASTPPPPPNTSDFQDLDATGATHEGGEWRGDGDAEVQDAPPRRTVRQLWSPGSSCEPPPLPPPAEEAVNYMQPSYPTFPVATLESVVQNTVSKLLQAHIQEIQVFYQHKERERVAALEAECERRIAAYSSQMREALQRDVADTRQATEQAIQHDISNFAQDNLVPRVATMLGGSQPAPSQLSSQLPTQSPPQVGPPGEPPVSSSQATVNAHPQLQPPRDIPSPTSAAPKSPPKPLPDVAPSPTKTAPGNKPGGRPAALPQVASSMPNAATANGDRLAPQAEAHSSANAATSSAPPSGWQPWGRSRGSADLSHPEGATSAPPSTSEHAATTAGPMVAMWQPWKGQQEAEPVKHSEQAEGGTKGDPPSETGGNLSLSLGPGQSQQSVEPSHALTAGEAVVHPARSPTADVEDSLVGLAHTTRRSLPAEAAPEAGTSIEQQGGMPAWQQQEMQGADLFQLAAQLDADSGAGGNGAPPEPAVPAPLPASHTAPADAGDHRVPEPQVLDTHLLDRHNGLPASGPQWDEAARAWADDEEQVDDPSRDSPERAVPFTPTAPPTGVVMHTEAAAEVLVRAGIRESVLSDLQHLAGDGGRARLGSALREVWKELEQGGQPSEVTDRLPEESRGASESRDRASTSSWGDLTFGEDEELDLDLLAEDNPDLDLMIASQPRHVAQSAGIPDANPQISSTSSKQGPILVEDLNL
ncbi:hypothetical protein CYMTET_56546 [Cymbomonas tetramitiformis]|uniref:TORTIFOLIA1/SINE1-2 N-terminal domain-containing protein n=1 Tax=Cymbomonas tetramitiformis TaxID=36881 RepID=A0AAE0ELQ4_9CHLO|nr:hypothetical protein CYMTET_56546 [Cymbomonas tetramitiformis]